MVQKFKNDLKLPEINAILLMSNYMRRSVMDKSNDDDSKNMNLGVINSNLSKQTEEI